MDIYIIRAVGRGTTRLSAFDDALLRAGVANFNLIHLSSVIPPGARIIRRKPPVTPADFGQRLYCVYAAEWAFERNETAYAGLGWVIDAKDRKGLFIEQFGRSREKVQADIVVSLTEMMARRDGFKRHRLPIHSEIAGGRCTGQPICALTLAYYQVERF